MYCLSWMLSFLLLHLRVFHPFITKLQRYANYYLLSIIYYWPFLDINVSNAKIPSSWVSFPFQLDVLFQTEGLFFFQEWTLLSHIDTYVLSFPSYSETKSMWNLPFYPPCFLILHSFFSSLFLCCVLVISSAILYSSLIFSPTVTHPWNFNQPMVGVSWSY